MMICLNFGGCVLPLFRTKFDIGFDGSVIFEFYVCSYYVVLAFC